MALAFSLEGGENFGKPIQGRICARYPTLSVEDTDALEVWCREVSGFAYGVIEKVYEQDKNHVSEAAMAPVREKYPAVNEENLTHLHNQGMYYAWHG